MTPLQGNLCFLTKLLCLIVPRNSPSKILIHFGMFLTYFTLPDFPDNREISWHPLQQPIFWVIVPQFPAMVPTRRWEHNWSIGGDGTRASSMTAEHRIVCLRLRKVNRSSTLMSHRRRFQTFKTTQGRDITAIRLPDRIPFETAAVSVLYRHHRS